MSGGKGGGGHWSDNAHVHRDIVRKDTRSRFQVYEIKRAALSHDTIITIRHLRQLSELMG